MSYTELRHAPPQIYDVKGGSTVRCQLVRHVNSYDVRELYVREVAHTEGTGLVLVLAKIGYSRRTVSYVQFVVSWLDMSRVL